MSLRVRILMDSKADSNEKEAVKGVLEAAGFEAELDKRVYIRKSAQEFLPWLLILYMEFKPFVKSFLEAFGSQLGKDAAIGLKDLFSRIAASRTDPVGLGGRIVLRDEQTGIELWIPNGQLSEEAARSFPQIDLSSFRTGPVVWDDQEKRWTSSTSHGQVDG